MSKEYPLPYAAAELVGGRLVRICPVCRQQIGERTPPHAAEPASRREHKSADVRA
jgi:hypothetical protein